MKRCNEFIAFSFQVDLCSREANAICKPGSSAKALQLSQCAALHTLHNRDGGADTGVGFYQPGWGMLPTREKFC